jgi:hypothetical protein
MLLFIACRPSSIFFSPFVVQEELPDQLFAVLVLALEPIQFYYVTTGATNPIGEPARAMFDSHTVAPGCFRTADAFDLDLREDFVFEVFRKWFRHSRLP